MTYVILNSEPGLWTVGCYVPVSDPEARRRDGKSPSGWEPFDDYPSEVEAAAWCSYLNGGLHPAVSRALEEELAAAAAELARALVGVRRG